MAACARALLRVPLLCIVLLQGEAMADAVDTICILPHAYRRSGFIETVPSLQRAKGIWEQCQNCPDAWSKCEPCSDRTVLQTALDIVEHLRFGGDKEQANAALLESAVDYYATALRMTNRPESSVRRDRLRDEVEVGLADLYYFDLGRADQAVEHYRNLVGAKVDAEIATHARLMLGELRLDTGDWPGAERELRVAAARGAGYKTLCALYKQSWALLRMGRNAEARRALRTCTSARVEDLFFENRTANLRKACAALLTAR
jgi:tetratricopeptide (TPR) repeat protein